MLKQQLPPIAAADFTINTDLTQALSFYRTGYS